MHAANATKVTPSNDADIELLNRVHPPAWLSPQPAPSYETGGFVRVDHERGRLRGCTIAAPHAGDMISEASYAMTHRGTLAALSPTIHPYSTQAEALRKAGDSYRRQSLTPRVRRWLERYFAWTR